MKFESPSGYKEPNHGLILFILLSVIGIFSLFSIDKLYTGIKKAFDIEYSIAYTMDESFYETAKIDKVVPTTINNSISDTNVNAYKKVDVSKDLSKEIITPPSTDIEILDTVKSMPEVSKIIKDSAEIKKSNIETKAIKVDTTNKIIAPLAEDKKKKFRLFKKKP